MCHKENRYGRTVIFSEFLSATFCLSKHWKSVILGNRFLNYFKGFNVFLHEFHSVRGSLCLLHIEIFQHLLQLGCGSTVIEVGSVYSCFPSSTGLIWINNGHLISFTESTVAPCWLLGNHYKACWFKVNPSDFFNQIWNNRVKLYWVSMIFTWS